MNFDKINFFNLYNLYSTHYFDQIKITSQYNLSPKECQSKINEFYESPFLSSQIKSFLHQPIQLTNTTFSLHTPSQSLSFHFITTPTTPTKKLAKIYFFLIFLRLQLNKSNTLFSNPIFINIIPLPIPKTFNKPITINDINSASTQIYTHLYGGPIYIWRSDELEKVLVHETLHSLHYDYDIINQKLSPELKYIENKIDHGKGLNINEAYVELCAVFIMSLFHNDNKKMVRKKLEKEFKHSLDNCTRLLKIYGCKNLLNCQYEQEASAFSYIIIKTALMWSLMYNCKKKMGRTNKLKCYEDFISVGFWGKIGDTYQDIIYGLLTSKRFNLLLEKNNKKNISKKNILYFTIFH